MPTCVIGHYCVCKYNQGGKCCCPVKPPENGECKEYQE